MRREPAARSPSPLGDGLGKVDAAARHLLGVINQVLDLSKIEAGKQPLELADFELDQVLAAALAMVDRAACDKGLSLVLAAPGLPTRLHGDAQLLTQALVNLLANAVKFTDRGSVCLRGLRPDDLGGRIRLRFEVQDTGIGIPAAQQPALFQPFEQGDASTTRRHGGTGLGLALTRHLAALMGGEVGVHSEPLAGSSCFWFTALFSPAAGGSAPAPMVPGLQGLRALLVDDEPASQAALVAGLSSLGLQVDTRAIGTAGTRLGGVAPGPATGEDCLSQARHDVLLVAASLATDEGFARLLALRAAQVPADLPCVLLVRAGSDGGPVAATLADAVLVKPATGTALRRSLLQALDPRRRIAATASDGLPLPGVAEQRLRARHAGQCVLLAEDNPVNREIAEAQLRWVGLDVRSACHGDEAVTIALTGAFDLVLMDMHMPVMDGIAATRAIRAAGVDRVPIIAMTASAYAEPSPAGAMR